MIRVWQGATDEETDMAAEHDWGYEHWKANQDRIDEIASRWLKDTIAHREIDELWCAIGDDFPALLWEVGATQEPFNEALERECISRHWPDIFDYVESIVHRDDKDGTITLL